MGTFEERIQDFLSNAYDIERELGGGGMSRVFVARDRLLGRRVVIKLLSPELTAEVNRGRFHREIQVAAQLQHPHIVTLLSAGEDGDLVYYTMPFIDGESLKSALEKHGQLAVADVVRVLYDVVDALAYAHKNGVVHRDIKPANILRSGNHALVTDFGVAKALNASMPSSAMTSTGMAIGTPAYMSPEQLAGDASADHRIDIYAVGLLAYELLSGQSPFAATTAQGVLAAVLTREPKPLWEVRKEVPRKLSAIIMSCLSKIPGGRPPSAEALLDSLDMIATSSGEIRTREHKVPARPRTTPILVPVVAPIVGPVTGPITEPTIHEAAPSAPKRRGQYLVAAMALIAVAATAALALSRRSGQVAPAVSIQPPAAASAEPAPATSAATSVVTPTVTPPAVSPAPAVITRADTLAIAKEVEKRLALEAAAAAKKGQPKLNADSLKKRVQRDMTDSINRANAGRAAAAQPVAPPVTAPAAPLAPPPVATTPVRSAKSRLAITEPRQPSDQPAINSFTKALIDALRVSLDNGDAFDVVDQDSVHDAITHTKSRDEAAKILKPDVFVSPGYVGSGDNVTLMVTVWDLRSNSSYGIRVSSTKLDPSKPEIYLGPIVQSVMKQLDDLARTPTIYRR
jgi:serine/threonine protein kinase